MIYCFPQYQIIGSRLCTIICTLRGHSSPIYSGRKLKLFKQLDAKFKLFEHLFKHVGFGRPLSLSLATRKTRTQLDSWAPSMKIAHFWEWFKYSLISLWQVIKGQAAVHRCSAEIDFLGKEHPTIPPTVNDDKIYEHVRRVSSEIVGEENIKLAPCFTGSEDFAFYLDKVPGSFLFLGTRNEKIGAVYPPHSPYYIVDEDVLPIGAAIHATFAHSYLSDLTRKLHSRCWQPQGTSCIFQNLPQIDHQIKVVYILQMIMQSFSFFLPWWREYILWESGFNEMILLGFNINNCKRSNKKTTIYYILDIGLVSSS